MIHEDTEALIEEVYKVLPPVMAHRWHQYGFWVQVQYLKQLREVFNRLSETSAEAEYVRS